MEEEGRKRGQAGQTFIGTAWRVTNLVAVAQIIPCPMAELIKQ